MAEIKPKKLAVTEIKTDVDLKLFLHQNYFNQIKNFFSDEKQAMKFLSSVMADVQKNKALMGCEMLSVINSYMTMAQLGLMPSGVSGEAYVLPYKKNTKNPDGKTWTTTMLAQFQLGYQGLITLFYRAGGSSVRAEIVRKNDEFSYVNGQIKHSIDIFKSNKERGEAIGAYAIALVNGVEIAKAMNSVDILAMGKAFSKSFDSKHTPWNEESDPELWMWKKTVLKQLGKMLPKNETINRAIAEDNKDSIISDRLEAAKKDVPALSMGAIMKDTNANKENTGKTTEGEDVIDITESDEGGTEKGE